MSRVVLAAALAAGLLVPAAASADPVQQAGSRFVQKGAEQVAATCRRSADREECARLLGTPDASDQAVREYVGSETSRALDLQRALGDGLPLQAGMWIGTHNSANSTSEDPTLSQSDSNQQLSLTAQLDLDVRSLELDAHWFPSLRSPGRQPVLCHARGANEGHAGCTTERLLEPALREVRRWLDAHPDEVVLLYLEDHLEGLEGHQRAGEQLADVFRGLLYAPTTATGCTQLPLDLSRQVVRDAGKQVVVMTGGCASGAGAAWYGTTFSERLRKESRPVGYGDADTCGGVTLAEEDRVFRRYFEDSTVVNPVATIARQSELDDGITPPTAAAMTRCGVDLLGLDQLVPGDGRLDALVWTFAPGELDAPGGQVAVQRSSDGRWESQPAAGRLPAACRRPDGSWTVTGPGPRVSAKGRCEELDASLEVPRRGRDAHLLRKAQVAAGAERVWLPLETTGAGSWS